MARFRTTENQRSVSMLFILLDCQNDSSRIVLFTVVPNQADDAEISTLSDRDLRSSRIPYKSIAPSERLAYFSSVKIAFGILKKGRNHRGFSLSYHFIIICFSDFLVQ